MHRQMGQHPLQPVTDKAQPSRLHRLISAAMLSWPYVHMPLLPGAVAAAVGADDWCCAQAIDVCAKDSRLRPFCDTNRFILMGHSRGAKLSCLIAEQVRQPCCAVVTDGQYSQGLQLGELHSQLLKRVQWCQVVMSGLHCMLCSHDQVDKVQDACVLCATTHSKPTGMSCSCVLDPP
jgi:hypothetical protein